MEEALPLDENGEFPSFAQYVSSLITGTLYRLRGFSSNPNSVTMDTDGEDLGPEVAPAAASKYYGSAVPSLRMRFRIGLGLLAILAWISLGLPVSGMLRTVKVAAGMCLALQLVIMLLSLDVITTAAVNMARLRFGADSLAALTCVLTSFDALAVALDAFGTSHMPLCLLSSLSLLGVLYSSLLAARGLRKALRVPSIAKRCYSVTGESELKGKGITLLKTDRPIVGFVRRTEEAGPDETAFLRAAPALLILSLIFAVVIARGDGSYDAREVTVTDTIPEGLTITGIKVSLNGAEPGEIGSVSGVTMTRDGNALRFVIAQQHPEAREAARGRHFSLTKAARNHTIIMYFYICETESGSHRDRPVCRCAGFRGAGAGSLCGWGREPIRREEGFLRSGTRLTRQGGTQRAEWEDQTFGIAADGGGAVQLCAGGLRHE